MIKKWFTSFFGVLTTILLLHQAVSLLAWAMHWCSGWWPAIAGIFIGCHVFAFAGMACFILLITGGIIDTVIYEASGR